MNIVFVGDSGVGKTSLIRKLTYTHQLPFQFNQYKPTIGLDFKKYHSYLLWDTAGRPRFDAIVKSYIKNVFVFVIVYINTEESFDSVQEYINQIIESKSQAPYVVVCNNIDDARANESKNKNEACYYPSISFTFDNNDCSIDKILLLAKQQRPEIVHTVNLYLPPIIV